MPQRVQNSIVAKIGKRKLKEAGNEVRTGWKDLTELKAFYDLCAALVLDGKRSGGYLRKEGVDAVIKQLGEMGKVVTRMQIKNKLDHLRKQWKTWKEIFKHKIGLGYDPVTRKIYANDEWWIRKFEVSSLYIIVKNSTVYNYIVF